MKYLSLFSGIDACSVAWLPLNWECVGFSEIEPFPCAVLKHHYPDVPNLGDITKITEDMIKSLGNIDLIVFGSPCQDLSIAGQRTGFNGEKSSLFYDAIRIIEYAKKHCNLRFALWENVYGSFTSNNGKDFTKVVEQMVGLRGITQPEKWCKEGAASSENGMLEWRTLDAKWFGVPQQRRRVFALADYGDWQSRRPILLEQKLMYGTFEQITNEKQNNSRTIENCFGKHAQAFRIDSNNSNAMKSKNRESGFKPIDIAPTLTATNECPSGARGGMVIVDAVYVLDVRHPDVPLAKNVNISPTVAVKNLQDVTMNSGVVALDNLRVRHFTVKEAERLQGFPDDYTKIPYRNKPAEQAPRTLRYKALGNSMAVPVMRWIGEQIESAIKLKT